MAAAAAGGFGEAAELGSGRGRHVRPALGSALPAPGPRGTCGEKPPSPGVGGVHAGQAGTRWPWGRLRGGPCALLAERSRAQGLEGAALDACAAGTTLRGCKSGGSCRRGRDTGELGGAPRPDSGPYTCVSAGWHGGALYLHCRKPCLRATLFLVSTLSSRGFPP